MRLGLLPPKRTDSDGRDRPATEALAERRYVEPPDAEEDRPQNPRLKMVNPKKKVADFDAKRFPRNDEMCNFDGLKMLKDVKSMWPSSKQLLAQDIQATATCEADFCWWSVLR